MPAISILKAVRSQTGLSVKRIDRLWDKAKRLVAKQYPDLKRKSSRYYAATMGIFKRMTRYKPKSELAEGMYLELNLRKNKLLKILEAYICTR